MKSALLALALIFCLALPSVAADNRKIVIGVTPFPHKDIMLIVKKLLEKEGYTLEIKEFTDYVQPNLALAGKSLDANFFQHIPYLDNMNREKRLNLAWVAKIHIEPLCVYSKKIKRFSELQDGDTLAIPNDPTNEARALRLLETNKLISLKPGVLVTVQDITANPKNLKILELEAAQLPRTLQDVSAAVINTNFAVEAELMPSRDAIAIESKDSPYANVIAVRADTVNTPAIKALVNASHSPEVKTYIENELLSKGIVPAF